jgi:hypothetical protein
MAMAKCRECGTEVSDEAKACPKCGISKPVRKTSTFTKIVAVLFAFAFIVGALTQIDEANDSPEERAAKEAARKEKFDREVQPLVDAGRDARRLRDSMRDPASFELVAVIDMGNGTRCFQYRARNGFGGMNVGYALSTPDAFYTENSDGFQARFKRTCSGSGVDRTADAIRWMDR